jgi:hypothetical protein
MRHVGPVPPPEVCSPRPVQRLGVCGVAGKVHAATRHSTAHLNPALQHPPTCVFTAVVVGIDETPGSLHFATGDPSTHMLLKLSQPVHATAAAGARGSAYA